MRFVIVCESDADRRVAARLADRILLDSVEWLEPDLMDSNRSWIGVEGGHDFLKWTRAKDLGDRLRVKPHGHFSGIPGEPDAMAARRALIVVMRLAPDSQAVLLIRDSDNDERKRLGLEQARSESTTRTVVIGVAHPKRECWLLASFEPMSKNEEKLLTGLKKELGFNPIIDSHKLTAKTEGSKKCAKTALARLCSNDVHRQESGIDTGALDTLRANGKHNGLCDYFDEVQQRLVPLFSKNP